MNTDRQYVLRAAHIKGVSIIKPTRAAPGILGTLWLNGFGHHVIDAATWAEARQQINSYFMAEAA